MEKFKENVEKMIDVYFKLKEEECSHQLSQNKKGILSELSVYFFNVSEVYNNLKDKSKSQELDDKEKTNLMQSEVILTKRYQREIEQMNIQDLSRNIFKYKYNDFRTSFDEFYFQLIINAFSEKISIFLNNGIVEQIGLYYGLCDKKETGVVLDADEERKIEEVRTILVTLETIYDIYKEREAKETLNEIECKNLVNYEDVLVQNFKIKAERSTSLLLEINIDQILGSGVNSPSQKLNLEIMQEIVTQRNLFDELEIVSKKNRRH